MYIAGILYIDCKRKQIYEYIYMHAWVQEMEPHVLELSLSNIVHFFQGHIDLYTQSMWKWQFEEK